MLARHILKSNPESLVVTCLNSGSAIEDMAKESGSDVVRTKVGSVEVSRKMVSTGALLGFEENGGFMFGPHNQVRDGCMTLALMLDLLAACPGTMSDAVSALPPSFTTKDKIRCSPEAAMRLISSLKEEFPDADTTDGIKMDVGSGGWVMIRPSGTEPIVRIYAEAGSREALDDLMSEYVKSQGYHLQITLLKPSQRM